MTGPMFVCASLDLTLGADCDKHLIRLRWLSKV